MSVRARLLGVLPEGGIPRFSCIELCRRTRPCGGARPPSPPPTAAHDRSLLRLVRAAARQPIRGGGARSRSCGGAHRPLSGTPWRRLQPKASRAVPQAESAPVSGSEVAGQLRLRRSPHDQCQGASRAPSWCSQERLLCPQAADGARSELHARVERKLRLLGVSSSRVAWGTPTPRHVNYYLRTRVTGEDGESGQ